MILLNDEPKAEFSVESPTLDSTPTDPNVLRAMFASPKGEDFTLSAPKESMSRETDLDTEPTKGICASPTPSEDDVNPFTLLPSFTEAKRTSESPTSKAIVKPKTATPKIPNEAKQISKNPTKGITDQVSAKSSKIPERIAFYGSIRISGNKYTHKALKQYMEARAPKIEVISFGSGRIAFDNWEKSPRHKKALALKPITIISDNIHPTYSEDFYNVREVLQKNGIEIWSNTQFESWYRKTYLKMVKSELDKKKEKAKKEPKKTSKKVKKKVKKEPKKTSKKVKKKVKKEPKKLSKKVKKKTKKKPKKTSKKVKKKGKKAEKAKKTKKRSPKKKGTKRKAEEAIVSPKSRKLTKKSYNPGSVVNSPQTPGFLQYKSEAREGVNIMRFIEYWGQIARNEKEKASRNSQHWSSNKACRIPNQVAIPTRSTARKWSLDGFETNHLDWSRLVNSAFRKAHQLPKSYKKQMLETLIELDASMQ